MMVHDKNNASWSMDLISMETSHSFHAKLVSTNAILIQIYETIVTENEN